MSALIQTLEKIFASANQFENSSPALTSITFEVKNQSVKDMRALAQQYNAVMLPPSLPMPYYRTTIFKNRCKIIVVSRPFETQVIIKNKQYAG